MADVRPFRGYRYNEARVGEIAQVICPPYDVISAAQEKALRERSLYNYINLEEGLVQTGDTEQNNKYTRATALLEQWINEDVLRREENAVFYLHEHTFVLKNTTYTRRDIMARVRLHEWEEMIIRPHEGTLSGPKSDRINLLWALNANTSPVFALYEDRDKSVFSVIEKAWKIEPVLDITIDNERHTLRLLTDEEILADVQEAFRAKKLYIADGHHRYESALSYKNELSECGGALAEDHPAGFVMMCLVDFDDAGLLILPPHRLLRGLSQSTLANLLQNLSNFFEVTPLDMTNEDYWLTAQELLNEPQYLRLGLYGLVKDGILPKQMLILTLKDFSLAADMMPYHHSQMYKKLDVSIVDHVILEEMLGLNSHEESMIAYVTDKDECLKLVDDYQYQLCFFVKAVTPDTIKAIADARDRMPRKSTYFFPKLPGGLFLNKLD